MVTQVNKAEKYNAACKQLSKLSVFMSNVGMQDFLAITDFLAKVMLCLEAGKECILVDDDDADGEDPAEPTECSQ